MMDSIKVPEKGPCSSGLPETLQMGDIAHLRLVWAFFAGRCMMGPVRWEAQLPEVSAARGIFLRPEACPTPEKHEKSWADEKMLELFWRAFW